MKDLLSGATVALALIPEAIAFSLVAGVNPTVGLYAAFFMCLITAIFGGRPGMISGATGSMAVVMLSIMMLFPKDYTRGINHLFATVMLTGVIQIIFSALNFSRFAKMMPKSVAIGFVNGLAIVIFTSQLQQFKYTPEGLDYKVWLKGDNLCVMIALTLVAMLITNFLPRFTKVIPSALTAITMVTLAVLLTPLKNIYILTVGDMITSDAAAVKHIIGIPDIPLNWNSFCIIVPYAFILAFIGLSESLMTLSLVDQRTKTKGSPNKECFAQGIANVISALFKSMGGCAMIGQSMINVSSGGRGRLSGIAAAILLLLLVSFGMPFIKLIPLAALVGVMLVVVIETFEWKSFKIICKSPVHDGLIIILVSIITVIADLAVAVITGIILASLVFAWQTAKRINAQSIIRRDGSKEYMLYGPLFFASSTQFRSLFTPEKDPQKVVINFQYSRISDHSAVDAVKNLTDIYSTLGKSLYLQFLTIECQELLQKSDIPTAKVNILKNSR